MYGCALNAATQSGSSYQLSAQLLISCLIGRVPLTFWGNSAWPIRVFIGRLRQNFAIRSTVTLFLSKIG